MEPYYCDSRVTLYNADCFEVMASLGDECVDVVITDPPYASGTHRNARKKLRRKQNIVAGVSEFSSMSQEDVSHALAECGRLSKGWVISTMDYLHASAYLVGDPPEGLLMRRVGVWMKTAPTPQLSGDRPAQGWEAIAYMHRNDRPSRWNGGGLHGNYYAMHDNSGIHPTAKPIGMVQDLVRKFSDPYTIVFDPFAGSGTTLRAALNEGRKAIGVEIEERYCEIIAQRLEQMCLDFDLASDPT